MRIGMYAIALCAILAMGSTCAGYRVTLTNKSTGTATPTPFAPGVWAVHARGKPLFAKNQRDRGLGLEALAEDGDPTSLAQAMLQNPKVYTTGIFNTPDGAQAPGPLLPGASYSFDFIHFPWMTHLSLATMLVESNDAFIGAAGMRLPLLEMARLKPGESIKLRAPLFDAGTETNEPPRSGPNQALRQSGANTGSMEGFVRSFADTTRALAVPRQLVGVQVEERHGTFTITLRNRSHEIGVLETPIAPVFFATHEGCFRLFEAGHPAIDNGLEMLAEDGSPAGLVAHHSSDPCVHEIGAITTTVERPGDGPGPAMPGESYSFDITPSIDAPYLSIAAMVVQSNDAFLAFHELGVRLVKRNGEARSAKAVARRLRKALAVWDAGTERNEVPGVGRHQAPRQMAAGAGAPDPDSAVRIYADETNDLEHGFAGLEIKNVPGHTGAFDVMVRNTSGGTAFPGLLTPVFHVLHDAEYAIFDPGHPSSAALERLAEAGDAHALLTQAEMHSLRAGVHATPMGSSDPGPLHPEEQYRFRVYPDSDAPMLSLATMVVPSNDTFFAVRGLQLLDDDGQPKTDEALAEAITAWGAWDAGTEANQAGAAGRDQAPRQASAEAGAPEGNGLVRRFDDPTINYGPARQLLEVRIERIEHPGASHR